jgi:molybdopterin-guanine dinucleotide biosynthesis protein A
MKGLLLIGGKSTRMGSDKSELILRDGLTQRQRGIKLLESFCDAVHVSTCDETGEDNTIADAFGSIGPLGAIASAQQHDPNSAWLVLACDLPMIEPEHLTTLTSSRDPSNDATCFESATDKLPEPLCAIWESSSAASVKAAINAGKRCPRSVLLSLNTNTLPSPGLWPLSNTNTKADLIEVRSRLNMSTTVKTVTVSYFAQLRELTGTSSETIETDSVTPAGLFEELRAKYSIPLKQKGMMVAVNGEFTDWTHPLTEGEEIVFIPPVAGG